ncbi:MAG: TonB-dependent receptor [Opitutus sp.]|nr:TonB-dependent receptor [Opitutus sp.]
MNPHQTTHPRRFPGLTAGAVALLALSALAPLSAQTAPAAAKKAPEEVIKMEAFVSTGTRFNNRTVTESPVPIDIVSNLDLKLTGLTEPAQILQRLVPSVNFPRTSISDGTDSARPLTLRGLASDQVLVLVNGKRRHASALINVNGTVGRGSGMVDLNAIPASAIGRIEVLRDGASAQYGSDALAGVINIVLRDSLTGDVDFSFGSTAEGDGTVYNFNFADGFRLGDKGKINISAYHRDREATDRSLNDTRQQYFGTGGTPTAANPQGLVAISGNYGSGTGASAAGGTLDSREASINRNTHRQGDSATKDTGFMINGETPLGSSGATLYGFGGYNDRKVVSYGFYRRAGQDGNIRAIFPHGFLPTFNNKVKDGSMGGGVKGTAGDWGYDASAVYGLNSFEFNVVNSVNVSLGAASPTRFYAGTLKLGQFTGNLDFNRSFKMDLAQPVKVAAGLEFRNENYKIEAGELSSYVDGRVAILDGPAAGGRAAAGSQVFAGFRPSDATDTSRRSFAVYVDAENQIAEPLTVSAAIRYEDFSDFGTTTNFKVSGRLKLPAGFALRGSVSTGFRVPSLGQQYFTSTATNFITVGGVLTPVDIRTLPVNTSAARALGATPLKAEKSNNYGFGLTYANGDAFSASVDYYQIKIDDRIVLSAQWTDAAVVQFFENQGLPGVGGGRYFTNAVDTKTEGVDFNARYLVRLKELGKVTLTGSYNINTTKVAGSRFGLQSDRTVLANSTLRQFTGNPLFDIIERVRMEKGQPRDSIQLGALWEVKKFNARIGATRFGEVSVGQVGAQGWDYNRILYLAPGYNVTLAPAYGTVGRGTGTTPGAFSPAVDALGRPNSAIIQAFPATWIGDVELGYEIVSGCRLAFGMQNVFDKYPQEQIRSKVPVAGTVATGSNNGQGADNIGIFRYSANGGAPMGINGRYSYVKLSYKF